MEPDYFADFEQAFVGRTCSIVREAPVWRANFGDGFTIGLEVPWRIVANGRVAFGDEDDGQWFGLPSPIDGEERAASLLQGRVVQAMQLDHETGDLHIVFDGNTRIDVFNQSCGYEGWAAYYSVGGSQWGVIAMGGGEIAVVPG
ncbi:DUF6188 family protein [Sphingosinicella humi]|uniref:Uncharacterized protein n=1 Tax=Allosphingosinicella humi TaxID=2068657 RepID=A0A2U2IZB3_9SPHN|nr:DUF6188 family protein [Sphingosinicella humi]PWG01433.1 hypothetical protein DF286_00005 [Sphingosinicella humi]